MPPSKVTLRRFAAAAAAVAGAAGVLAIPAGSNAGTDDVQPVTGFQGEVNGSSASGATVFVVRVGGGGCKVKPGQTVAVFRDHTPGGPRTGLTDTYVDEYFDWYPSQKIRITEYGQQHAQPIPTVFDAPCAGAGNAVFQPGPGIGGITDTVSLVFVEEPSQGG